LSKFISLGFIASVMLGVAGCGSDSSSVADSSTQSGTAQGGVSEEALEVVTTGGPAENGSATVMPADPDVTVDEVVAETPDNPAEAVPTETVDVSTEAVPTESQGVSTSEVLIANPDTGTVVGDSPITISILDNDAIPAGSSVTIETGVGPQGTRGWISVDQTAGTITYNPYVGAEPGTDQLGYKLRSDGEASDVAIVTVTLISEPPAAGCEVEGSANQTVSLLLLGNSLMNEIESNVRELLVCKGYTTDLASNNPGGSFLYQHNTFERSTSLIAEGYDLTLIQEHSTGITTHSPPYEIISQLEESIEAAGSEMGFYQTWGRQERDPVQTEANLSAYEEIAEYFDAPVVRIGRAWDYFYTSYNEEPPFSLYSDQVHATPQGMALISYVLYAYLTGESPVGLPSLTLNEDDALVLQIVALESHQSN